MPKAFGGDIKLDLRDRPPTGPPFSPPGSRGGAQRAGRAVRRHRVRRLVAVRRAHRDADHGSVGGQRAHLLTWHTTALCSPTRSVFLTGRDHHQVGSASISEPAVGFPGYNSHIPREKKPYLATVLCDAGWSTFWVGKTTTPPSATGRWDRPRRTGRSGWATTVLRTRTSPRSSSPPSRGGDRRPGLPVRRVLPVRQRRQLAYVYNFSESHPSRRCPPTPPRREPHRRRGIHQGANGEHHEAIGNLQLTSTSRLEARSRSARSPPATHCAARARDSDTTAVTREFGVYPGLRLSQAACRKVVFDVSDDAYVDVERELAAAMARD